MIEIVKQYLILGFTHVIPFGYDHILFILSIFLLDSNIKSLIIQCSIFTIAHSISLGLAASGILPQDSKIIEPLIAMTIVFTSIENILRDKVNNWRVIIIFIFFTITYLRYIAYIYAFYFILFILIFTIYCLLF